ncbi:uncharacterized protein DUF4350 [Streptomyces sp. DvalAA-21]|nr:putative secreted protein [Streptomyces sp. SirexAA-E]PZX33631.1 uncharacterized protein DUF4350 [Streptomyces sp. DvalAA-21]RAJ29514.1 uncharacterized protein DUF4350 [Streptomyces sp. DpondAA-E10]RAJ43481.1 uncharacterized protein DUF4350 [Streptomyces sp. DpondAA-A50]SCL85390.1 protein of unknown function [Streptomyces sp. DpondAA-F4]
MTGSPTATPTPTPVPVPVPGSPLSTTSVSRTPGQVWRRTRGLLLAALLLVAAGITYAAVGSGGEHGRLDPRSPDPYGSRAVAELLKDRGVTVDVVTTLGEATDAAGPDTTLLVAGPNVLTDYQRHVLRGAVGDASGRTVLVAPGRVSVGTLAPGVSAELPGRAGPHPPRCDLPAARSAGTVETGGLRYRTDARDAVSCYPVDGYPTYLVLPEHASGDTVLLGSPDLLYNDRLDQQGNASLALQTLGSRPHLVWYLPSLTDPSATAGPGGQENGEGGGDGGTTAGESGFVDLIPSGWLWGTLQLAFAAVLAAIWRARRLGPLVTERLPVAVRASESTEGRARLYRKANARDRAAATLRSATRNRLAPLVGVSPRDAQSPGALLPAVSARLDASDTDAVALLFGPAPADDAALVLLTDQLDALEREVRTS